MDLVLSRAVRGCGLGPLLEREGRVGLGLSWNGRENVNFRKFSYHALHYITRNNVKIVTVSSTSSINSCPIFI